jgi:NAD(P)-dependent dehydrogenase (short-subunit alcohol dehydrogenase family)
MEKRAQSQIGPIVAASVAAAAAGFLVNRMMKAREVRHFNLAGRVVLVTGGSRGLGLVLARELVAEGARIVICARDVEELERARLDLEARGGSVLAVPCDITRREEVIEVFRVAREIFGGVDALINNAGIIQVGPFENATLDDFDEAMRVHYWGALYAILEAFPEMRERGEGRIVNITSIGGRIAMPHLLPYVGSKFAITGLSEGLRAELQKYGIWVTTVTPGLMRTGSIYRAFFKGRNHDEHAWFSVSGSLPGASIGAEQAARSIIRALKRGEADLILSLPAHCAAMFHGAAPGVTADILGAVDRFLPAPGGIGEERAPGFDSTSKISPSILTALSDRAARENNELGSTEA